MEEEETNQVTVVSEQLCGDREHFLSVLLKINAADKLHGDDYSN